MRDKWKKLESWLKTHNPSLLADLNPPASDANIQELEQKIGAKLPMDFVEFLKIHNGQNGRSEWLFDGNEFLSTKNIVMSWSAWANLLENGDFDDKIARPNTGIQKKWWGKGWIPFATNGGGDYLCLDLTPSDGGNFGQIVKVFHDFPDRVLDAPSFLAWLDRFIESRTT